MAGYRIRGISVAVLSMQRTHCTTGHRTDLEKQGNKAETSAAVGDDTYCCYRANTVRVSQVQTRVRKKVLCLDHKWFMKINLH